MEQQVYKKVGRRYVPIGYSDGWTGFPAEGVWIVKKGDGIHSSECVLRLGELQDLQPAINLILGYKEELLKFFVQQRDEEKIFLQNISVNDFVLEMLKFISDEKRKSQ